MTHDSRDETPPAVPLPLLATRATLGGFLMGLANLVPGISGGTMLVASGIYPQFVDAVAQATRLRFTRRSVLVLGLIIGTAVIGIVALAGLLGQLVVEQTWIMYSLFIGLTLGGVPIVWAMADRHGRTFWSGAVAGLLAMTALAVVQMLRLGEGGAGDVGGVGGIGLMVVAGVAGAGAMILPGLSGGYLFLVLGVYVTILDAIDRMRQALQAGAWSELTEPVVTVAAPVALGVVLGVAVVSNLLKLALDRFPQAMLGVLLGLLLGAVVGLWPFQHGVPPEAGTVFKGREVVMVDDRLVFETTGEPIEPKDYPRQFFAPSVGQTGGSLALIGAGLAITTLVARLGGRRV